MSVIIRGMEMPTSCWGCHFGHEDTGICVVDFKNHGDWNEPQDCPLVQVPPHGELCDKTALIDKIGENIDKAKDRSYDWWYACTVAYDFALAAPTIIPAEERK